MAVNFDVTGLSSNPAAQLQVGHTTIGAEEGGGLSQTFSGPAGDYSFSFDFASEAPTVGNGQGGTFYLIVDGALLSSFDTDMIDTGTTERGSLNGSLAGVAAGTHEIKIQATRRFQAASYTPFQYFDNVVVSASSPSASVPGPLPVLGAAAAFRFSRKLRQRIKKSGNSASSTYTL